MPTARFGAWDSPGTPVPSMMSRTAHLASTVSSLCPTMHPKLIMIGKRTAQPTGLLSLPDELLVKIACSRDESDWAGAAATCKRLWDLQLSSAPVVETCQSEAIRMPHYLMCASWTVTGSEALIYLPVTSVVSIVDLPACAKPNRCQLLLRCRPEVALETLSACKEDCFPDHRLAP